MRRPALLAAAASVALTLGAVPASAGPDVNPGPRLSVPIATLDAALVCGGGDPDRATVLLIPGTTVAPEEAFGWNYLPAFDLDGRTSCTVELPDRAMADIQIAAEYVVHAIRTLRARSDRPIAIVGWSQGGMVGRWALKYWPDTRGMVEDLIGLAPSNHGTQLADVLCHPDCVPAIWQQRTGSAFLAALNDGPETWPGIDYTVVYSHTDGVIVPPESSKLTTGQGTITNVAVSDVCPGRTIDHVGLASHDPIAQALVFDALAHPGPAAPERIARAVCAALFQPGVRPDVFAVHYARELAAIGATLLLTGHSPTEPDLAPYAH